MNPTTVFLSSTCYDLLDLRTELAEYLRQHAFLVKTSDDYESNFAVDPTLDSVTTCLSNVETSDVLVCVLDRRYGPQLPANHKFAGRSATHAEIEHATALGMPVFGFVRERSHSEHIQILGDPNFRPRWIEFGGKDEMANLIKERTSLSHAIQQRRSNWLDFFKTSSDLKPQVLKRLLDAFPSHAGVFAMRPERIVRLYYRHIGINPKGTITGTFVNAGNGPALSIACGWSTRGNFTKAHSQGALQLNGELARAGSGIGVTFASPAGCTDLVIACEYRSAFGDRFKVEARMAWEARGYSYQGEEAFYVWVGGTWMPVT